MNRTISFNITGVAPGDFTTTSTRSAPGQANLQLVNNSFIRHNRIHTPSLVWRHKGPVWKAEAGVGLSRATGTFRDVDHGYFRSTTARRTGLSMSFADISYLRPHAIGATDATGPVDPYDIDNYVVTAATARPITALDRQRGANASATREFFGRLPFSVKAGCRLSRERARNTVGHDSLHVCWCGRPREHCARHQRRSRNAVLCLQLFGARAGLWVSESAVAR